MTDSLVFRSDRPWPNPRLRTGAVVGHATSTSVRLWLRTARPGNFALLLYGWGDAAASDGRKDERSARPFPRFRCRWKKPCGGHGRAPSHRVLDPELRSGHDPCARPRSISNRTPATDTRSIRTTRSGSSSVTTGCAGSVRPRRRRSGGRSSSRSSPCHMPYRVSGLFRKRTDLANLDMWDFLGRKPAASRGPPGPRHRRRRPVLHRRRSHPRHLEEAERVHAPGVRTTAPGRGLHAELVPGHLPRLLGLRGGPAGVRRLPHLHDVGRPRDRRRLGLALAGGRGSGRRARADVPESRGPRPHPRRRPRTGPPDVPGRRPRVSRVPAQPQPRDPGRGLGLLLPAWRGGVLRAGRTRAAEHRARQLPHPRQGAVRPLRGLGGGPRSGRYAVPVRGLGGPGAAREVRAGPCRPTGCCCGRRGSATTFGTRGSTGCTTRSAAR